MGRLDSQRAVHIDRESVMSGDESLFLDLTDKVKDLLSPAHRKGRDHNISSAVQSSLDDLRELLDVLMGPVMGAVAVSALHHHIIRLIRILRVLDQRLILVSDIAGEHDLFLYAVLVDPDLDGRGAEQMADISKAYLDPFTDRQDIAVVARDKVL